MKNLDKWMQIYEQKLVESHPAGEIPFTVHRMRSAFERCSYDKDSHAVKATCKHFGVKHTYKAIYEFLAS